MSVDKRPYAGNWSSDIKNKYRRVTSWTPDAIVKFNGETSLPGCRDCNNRIDFQSFITSVNVNGGLDSLSCDISLTIPKHYGDSIFKDGAFNFQTGVEVHVYYRGFFSSDGLAEDSDTFKDQSTDTEYDLSKVEMRPYYPVFHGVVTSVNYSYSGGFYSSSFTCASMLHFWENQKINTNSAYMAAAPTESRGSVRTDGHVYTNMTPHQIIYDLFRDTGGSADGLDWAWSSKSNIRAKSSGSQEFFSLSMRYWERRFSQGLYDLRMYGASGRLYTSTEQAYLTNLYRGKGLEKEILLAQTATLNPSASAKAKRALNRAIIAGGVAKTPQKDIERTLDVAVLAQTDGRDTLGMLTVQLKNFITNLDAIGNISLFTTSYESKKDIAKSVSDKCGMEFYQDFDGDLVFKPPMYNLDTSSSRIYRIQREDIIDISFTHDEPQATYVICKGTPYRNTSGHGLEGEFGVRSTYVDYKLVAKYGWRPMEFETSFFDTKTRAFYAAVVELDKTNRDVNKASCTIPLRPEIKMGYPVYIEHIDTFYYVTSVNHSFSFGGDCTTTLDLTARRKKFVPPGNPNVTYEADPYRAVDFERTFLPPKALYRDVGSQSILGQSDNSNDYRQTGFPNVVMALDTTKMDPSYLYFPLGYDIQGAPNSSTRKMFRNMIIMEGYRLGILRLRDYKSGPSSPAVGDFNALDDVYFKGPWVVSVPASNGGRLAEVEIYLEKDGSFPAEESVRALSRSLSKNQTQASKTSKKGRFTKAKQAREESVKIYDEAINKLKNLNLDTGVSSGSMTIVDLINIYKYANKVTGQGVPDPGSPSSIISLLSDKKASFSPNQPGYYRYFSSSHPDPRHQAPDVLNVSDNGDVSLKTSVLSRPDATRNNMVVAVNDDVVDFKEKAPTRGLVTKTFYTQKAESTPSKDILALSFTKHTIKTPYNTSSVAIGTTVKSGALLTGIGANILRLLKKAHEKGMKGKQLENKLIRTRPKPSGATMKSTASFLFGTDGNRIGTNTVITKDQLPLIANQTKAKIAQAAFADYPKMFGAVTEDTPKEISSFIKDMAKIYRSQSVVYSAGVKRGKTTTRYKTNTFLSPIFPVSDENGYEVFGAYQYGRGLDIIPRNTFDQILRQDLTRVFTEEELDLFLEDLYKAASSARSNLVARATNRILEREGGIQQAASRYGLRDVDNREQFLTQLENAIATRNDDQVVANIPVAIERIRPETRGNAECSCRRTDDDLVGMLLSSGQANYISIGDSETSDVMIPYRDQMLARAEDWKKHQDALKGNINALSSGEVPYFDRVSTISEGISLTGENENSIGDTVSSLYDQTIGRATDNLSQANENMRDAFREEVKKTKDKEE
jgi:hypothetical protein